jgi:signal transduction histidine kinase
MDWLDRFLMVRGLAPHGYCLLWDPALVWTHVVSDALIATAYFSIPLVLWRLLTLRRDVQFGWMLGLFAVFILACGLTHVMGIVTLWVPAYGWEALVKVVTAAASLATAALLIPLLPRLVAIPSPAALAIANQALQREARERERTEAMLRQSQKMEAIGQLTGGVAHDFNNILGVIIANLDRAKRRCPDAPELGRALDNALAGAERAARLTNQLLAFSRQQPLERKPHSINEIATSTTDMIREIVGSNIEVKLALDPAPMTAVVDRSQLENALLNLAINARDAMEQGGVLTVSTRAEGSNTIQLAVSDTGTGMGAETLNRAADPFFTTKPVGKGSGLGLSQVVGTVEQLGGRVEIESREGTGTTVRLFLPIEESGNAASEADSLAR